MGFFLQRQKKVKPSTPKRDINDGIYTKLRKLITDYLRLINLTFQVMKRKFKD